MIAIVLPQDLPLKRAPAITKSITAIMIRMKTTSPPIATAAEPRNSLPESEPAIIPAAAEPMRAPIPKSM